MKALLAIKDGFQFRLGDGNSSFWYTNWSDNGILANQVLYVDIHDLQMRVRDVYIDGKFNLNSLYTPIPPEIVNHLNLLPICLNPLVADRYTWKGNLNGIYTARDGYHWLNRIESTNNSIEDISWSWLWHIEAPEKIKFFLWTALHNALPTRAMLSHRRLLSVHVCPRSDIAEETIMHCLRDCEFVKHLWKTIGFTDQTFFHGDNLYAWLRKGCDSPSMFMFLAALWWIWRARNKLCLANELVSPFTISRCIEDYALLVKKCYSQQKSTLANRLVRWNAHDGTDMILNVDGSSIGNPEIYGFGGLIRNSHGAWIRGFAGNIGFSNILHAELLAVYHGLVLAWDMDIKDLICYSDSKTAIKLIGDPINEWHHFAAILQNIKDILARDWRVTVAHTLREGNACADYLAKFGAQNIKVFSTMTTPPDGMNLLLLADASGTWFTR
ncbi:hypothetical protein TSUD_105620 [Trifolium subterraneum]|uniref:RNase H type-1 domain-containing protein n=1 Tax=Trifolium subterraneum TaxID=3900 RepID=A0A2Z6LIM4_TRISU|nr:hypothetical protein TSUD_105620 [Trifolium subterraneum]